jgi:outer membrane protein OmpU
MNKITKLGVSALCGSLAAVSAANAGDLTVTGGVDMSWLSLDDTTTGNNIGIGSNLTFKGSGELDNGWSVALSVAMTNSDAYSNTNVVVTVPSLGDIRIDQGTSGTGLDRIDDVTPTVWEEAYAAGVGSGIAVIKGSSGGSTIEYTPNMMPDGLTAVIAYTPDASGKDAADKATVAGDASNPEGSGFDLTLTATDAITGVAGLTLYGGIAEISQDATTVNYSGDQEETTWAIKYAAGGFTVGYQWAEQDLGTTTNETEYENRGYGITFNVNDDLSVGYVNYESEQKASDENTTTEAESFQIAYSMGGASIRLAETDVTNNAYQSAAVSAGAPNDRSGTTISVSLAF